MIEYLIYLLAFIIGSIAGLLYSYKQHSEPYVVVNEINGLACIISIIGWVLAVNSGSMVLSAIGLLLAGLVMGERPGYGRKESIIGLLISIIVYLLIHWTV